MLLKQPNNMYLFMYKNTIKKIATLNKALLQGKYFILGVLSWLKVWLKKCNYREYIKSNNTTTKKWHKAPIYGGCKGTIKNFYSKGSANLEKKLDTNFFNLVKSLLVSKPPLKPYVVGARSTFLTRLKLG